MKKKKINYNKKIEIKDALRLSVGRVDEAEKTGRFIQIRYGRKASSLFLQGFRYARNKLQESKDYLIEEIMKNDKNNKT
jgi:hypothetical protein